MVELMKIDMKLRGFGGFCVDFGSVRVEDEDESSSCSWRFLRFWSEWKRERKEKVVSAEL